MRFVFSRPLSGIVSILSLDLWLLVLNKLATSLRQTTGRDQRLARIRDFPDGVHSACSACLDSKAPPAVLPEDTRYTLTWEAPCQPRRNQQMQEIPCHHEFCRSVRSLSKPDKQVAVGVTARLSRLYPRLGNHQVMGRARKDDSFRHICSKLITRFLFATPGFVSSLLDLLSRAVDWRDADGDRLAVQGLGGFRSL